MAQSLDSISLSLGVLAQVNNQLDLQNVASPLNYAYPQAWVSGVLAAQADRLFTDTRTLAPSTAEDLDLAGVLIDPIGTVISLARVKALIIQPAAANVNNLIIGNAAANGWNTWVGAATHTVTVRPGGLFVLTANDATGYVVTAATGDLLHIANSGAGTSVTYNVIILGCSA